MTRLLTRVFLPLIILLLCARGHMFLHVHPQAGASISSSAHTNKAGDKLKAIEIEEDDETDPSRKECTDFNYYLSLFFIKEPDHTYHNSSRIAPFCQHFSYLSSSRSIIQRVLRI